MQCKKNIFIYLQIFIAMVYTGDSFATNLTDKNFATYPFHLTPSKRTKEIQLDMQPEIWEIPLQRELYRLTMNMRSNLNMTDLFSETEKIFKNYRIRLGSIEFDQIKSILAIGAYKVNNFELSKHLYEELSQSNYPEIRALALNGLGVLSWKENDPSSALKFWHQSTLQQEHYPAAILNLSHFYLQRGNAYMAKQNASLLQDTDHPIAQELLVSIERLSDNEYDTEYICESYTDNFGFSASVAYTCAVYYYLNKKNLSKSMDFLNQIHEKRASKVWRLRSRKLAGEIKRWKQTHQ